MRSIPQMKKIDDMEPGWKAFELLKRPRGRQKIPNKCTYACKVDRGGLGSRGSREVRGVVQGRRTHGEPGEGRNIKWRVKVHFNWERMLGGLGY